MSGMLIVGLNVPGQIAKANDGKRRNDLEQYKNLIQQYAISHSGKYPPNSSWTSVAGRPNTFLISLSTLCSSSALNLTGSNCLIDSRQGQIPAGNLWPLGYYYIVDSSATSPTSYVLLARLESSSSKFWEVCSTGLAGVVNTNPPPDDPSCPTAPAGPL